MRLNTTEQLLASKFRLHENLEHDERNTVRTGQEWFDRYGICAWEKFEFSLECSNQEVRDVA